MMSNTPYQYNRFAQIYASNLVTVSQNPLGKLVWSGSKMGWSDDGVNTFTFAAGSSGLNASTTKGIGISNSLIYVNASTTKGLAFDSSGKVYINASSTKYLKFSNGLLYWDSVGFLNATNLVTGKFEVPTPTVSSMATPKSYVDNGLLYGVATGTTSGTVSTGTAIYITPTGALAVTDTGAASSTFQFIGIANYTTSTGKTISYSQIGDTNCHLSGLKTGMWYYLSGSGGVLATTPVANKYARIGLAKSTTCLYITPPIYYTSGIQDATAATDYVIATGFYPAKITLYAASDNGGSKQGSIGSEANGSWQVQSGSSGYVYYDSGNAIYVADTGGGVIGTISARTSNSFTIHIATKTATNGANIRWMASSE